MKVLKSIALLGLFVSLFFLGGCVGQNFQTAIPATSPNKIGTVNPEKKEIVVMLPSQAYNTEMVDAAFLACVVRQLKTGVSGRKVTDAVFNDFQTGYREGSYVNGNEFWEQNSLVGLGVVSLKNIIKLFASRGVSIDTARGVCTNSLRGLIALGNERANYKRNLESLALDTLRVDSNLTPKFAAALCDEGMFEYCQN